MSSIAPRMGQTERFRGMLNILRFNWTFYATALGGSSVTLLAAALLPMPAVLRAAGVLIATAALYWTVASLLSSHWVYDRSGIYNWRWLLARLPFRPRRWVMIHAGLDESSPTLRQLLPDARGEVLDIYDPALMTEPAIARARRLAPADVPAPPAKIDALPMLASACDTVFLLFAAHEVRNRGDRERFFGELRRILAPGGQVVVVEHMRDLAGAIAFGPGCLHFYPRSEWLRLGRHAGFTLASETSFTPLVRCFVWRKPR